MKAYLEIEMPKSCYDCNLAYQDEDSVYWTCAAIHKSACMYERREDCPLVPIPTHGRLIDADALEASCFMGSSSFYTQSDIDNAPTIIEAEEGET